MNGKTFHLNIERNANQSGFIICGDKCARMNFPSPLSFYMKTQFIVRSPEGKHFKNVLNLSHSTTQTDAYYFYCKNDAVKQRDRQEQICTIQVTTLQMAFTITENF